MLTIFVSEKELFDERKNEFIKVPNTELKLEHSLISLSRWESKWKKPFLHLESPTQEEMVDYVCCMSVDKPIDKNVVLSLPAEDFIKIREYIADPHTATTITDRRPQKRKARQEIITSELLYYYMIYYGIPCTFEKWHLNRLLTLIRVCSVKGGTTNQEMSMNEIFAQNNKLNSARRAAMRNGK